MSNDQEILEQAALEEERRLASANELESNKQDAIDLNAQALEAAKEADELAQEQTNNSPNLDQSGIAQTVANAGLAAATGAAALLFNQNLASMMNPQNGDEFNIEEYNNRFNVQNEDFWRGGYVKGEDSQVVLDKLKEKSLADQGGEKFTSAHTNGNKKDDDDTTAARIARYQQMEILATQQAEAYQSLLQTIAAIEAERDAALELARKKEELENIDQEIKETTNEINETSVEAVTTAAETLEEYGVDTVVEGVETADGGTADIDASTLEANEGADGRTKVFARDRNGNRFELSDRGVSQAVDGMRAKLDELIARNPDDPTLQAAKDRFENSLGQIDNLKGRLSELQSDKNRLENEIRTLEEEHPELAGLSAQELRERAAELDTELAPLYERAAEMKEELEANGVEINNTNAAMNATTAAVIQTNEAMKEIDLAKENNATDDQLIDLIGKIDEDLLSETIEGQELTLQLASSLSNDITLLREEIAFTEENIAFFEDLLQEAKDNEIKIERDGQEHSVQWDYDSNRYLGINEDGTTFDLTDTENDLANAQWEEGKYGAGEISDYSQWIIEDQAKLENLQLELAIAESRYDSFGLNDENSAWANIRSLQSDIEHYSGKLEEAQNNQIAINRDGAEYNVYFDWDLYDYLRVSEDGSLVDDLTEEEKSLADSQYNAGKYGADDIEYYEQKVTDAEAALVLMEQQFENENTSPESTIDTNEATTTDANITEPVSSEPDTSTFEVSNYDLSEVLTIEIDGEEMLVAEANVAAEGEEPDIQYVAVDSEGTVHTLSSWQRFKLYSQDITTDKDSFSDEYGIDNNLSVDEVSLAMSETISSNDTRLAAANETDPEGRIQAEPISPEFQVAASGETTPEKTNDLTNDPTYQQNNTLNAPSMTA